MQRPFALRLHSDTRLFMPVPDFDLEALEYVFHDSDHVDRRILEMKLGYAGHPTLPPKAIAAALKLSPTQLSRRSARLSMRINNIASALKN